MAIGKDKTQILLTISSKDKEALTKLAKQDERSLTNYINKILKDHLQALQDNKKLK